MVYVQGCDISAHKRITKFSCLAKLLLAKKCPKLVIQLPNTGYDNQSCRRLRVIFNRIKKLRITKYNLYSCTLLNKNLSIYTSLWVCVLILSLAVYIVVSHGPVKNPLYYPCHGDYVR